MMNGHGASLDQSNARRWSATITPHAEMLSGVPASLAARRISTTTITEGLEMEKPLDGINVLSFELQVAGPYCSMMLADQGASVIKVEQPGSGDTARGGAPKVKNDRGEEQSGYFLRFNRNKRSLTLNLKSEAGRRDLSRPRPELGCPDRELPTGPAHGDGARLRRPVD